MGGIYHCDIPALGMKQDPHVGGTYAYRSHVGLGVIILTGYPSTSRKELMVATDNRLPNDVLEIPLSNQK